MACEAIELLFSSMEFLFLFFPVVLCIYFFLPLRARNGWLLLTSLLFYSWGEPRFVLAMIASIVFNYFVALRIAEMPREGSGRYWMLLVAVLVNLALLFVFKYLNFTISILHKYLPQTKRTIEQTYIALPIGISFFTFQALSYVVDVYRGLPPQENMLHLGLYISFFPQLIAGPIVRYTTIREQIQERTITRDDFAQGLLRFLRGFNKKVLLANVCAELADKAFGMSELSVGMAWLGALAYAMQIFFDFSGYSDMAIGIGRMFGFHFLENFNYPYISKSVTEFWRRWHISLGTWFRDYVYFPLGGSRVKSKGRLVLNLFITWMATGIWHGASWNFIFWGLLYGVLIIFEKLTDLPKKLEKHRIAGAGYMAFALLMVLMGWVLFRTEGIDNAIFYMKAMFGLNGNGLSDAQFRFCMREYAVILVCAIVLSTPLMKRLKEKAAVLPPWLLEGGVWMVQILGLIIGVSFLAMDAHNPFIYFNF